MAFSACNQSNNHRDIESQLMNRFFRDNFIYSLEFPEEFRKETWVYAQWRSQWWVHYMKQHVRHDLL